VTSASPPSALEQLQLRERLEGIWREQVKLLTVVTRPTRSPAGGFEAGAEQSAAAARRLATARATLIEAEAAMRRMAERRYGICEWCSRRIPTADLLAVPLARRCARCGALKGAVDGHPGDGRTSTDGAGGDHAPDR